MSANESHQIEMKDRQYEFLEAMAEKYGLPDASKAARCLIDYAIERSEQEASIFGEVRCLDC